MASKRSDAIRFAVHTALVVSTKAVVSSHNFAKDTWFEYCHNHAPIDERFNTVTLDPSKYSVAFLGDFLSFAARDGP